MNDAFAEHFARDGIDSWNSHDLQRILSHYADDFEMSSPVIIQLADEPSGTLRGKAAADEAGLQQQHPHREARDAANAKADPIPPHGAR